MRRDVRPKIRYSLLSLALAAVTALSLFACSRSGEPKDSEANNLPTGPADTVAATGTPDESVTVGADSADLTETATETTPESTAPSTEAPSQSVEVPSPPKETPQPPATPESAAAPLEPVIPSPLGGGSLDTGVAISSLSAAQNKFLSGTVFVGDSICSGLDLYGVLPDDNVLASTSNSVHAIDSFQFTLRGASYDYITALKILDPQNVIFFMGMNDTYLSASSYCDSYAAIISKVRAALPEANLYIASITPVSASCTYTTNGVIDNMNAQVRSRAASIGCGFVDVSSVLKGGDNCLIPEYAAGDGIHISSAAYYKIVTSAASQLAP